MSDEQDVEQLIPVRMAAKAADIRVQALEDDPSGGGVGAMRTALAAVLADVNHPAWLARDALRRETAANVRRAVADEVEDALGDRELLPAAVRAAFDDLLHRLRTGREL